MTARPSPVRLVQGLIIFASVSTLAWAQKPAPLARVAPGRWAQVAHALGVAGQIRGEVFRVDFAPLVGRVSIHAVRLAPGTIERPWVAFGQEGGLGWMMGRLPLPASRCPSVAANLVQSGLQVSGIDDPLPGSTPALSVIYFRGMGDSVNLARELKKALGDSLRPPRESPVARIGRLDQASIERVIGFHGRVDAGALVFHLARPETVKCCGLPNDPLRLYSGIRLVPASGMESRIAFQPSGAVAAVFGRLALSHGETDSVERALAVFGLRTVETAEPFADEYPRILFLHFYGKGKPLDLAQGVRAAIERIHHLPPVTPP